ncbi:ATP-dependent helicase/deoxyribonuclease subunit B [Kurthia zopfii]|uniref:ATP-dependent helicase/deoxyribonuclease subunit B n=1 Tax=Kurthia zopfii TaxID=1650 RepID=A0A8B4Q8V1_9BACL|nr:helicase-exonuclease AddAB subunit AddB [Kurthia zopfii]PWI21176.1 helicase-exonuclease AddAB subunit AddB [Kurthia zopfii]TDR33401.1 DNA helicase/exodeoxyribonuclease V subunit B [Kurthia zopfii]GEK32141.1 ATP-dependent helicase/deoxyribonuclease subunit B [Kurthia zopfii]STX08834.1 ATP-dependent helicase/deoxyribonuclease subunit B [Kurthia zopfii]
MALTIISGRSGSGKTTYIQNEITNSLNEHSIGDPIFIIIPDQMSFSTEFQLTNTSGVGGMIRAQATTFKRLAWRVLSEVGGISREEINGFGYRMLIRSVLLENAEQLSLFKKSAGKRGFTEEVESILKEFSRYSLDYAKLTDLKVTLENNPDAPATLKKKMHDLQIIMNGIESKLGTTYVDSEGYIPLLIQAVEESNLMKQSHIYIDGFNSFTTREFELVTQLIRIAKDVTIVLPFDSEMDATEVQSLFHQPALLAQKLKDFAFQYGVEVKGTVHLAEQRRYQSNDLKYIEKSLGQYPVEQMTEQSDGGLQIIGATTRKAEIHGIAREIRRFIQEGNRYRDIAILYRQADAYDPLITTIFKEYEIPVFVSQKKPMLHHPLIELSRSVLEVIDRDWLYEPVFRAIKTDLFFPTGANTGVWRERADRLENFVIANGIYKERWFDDHRWLYKKYRGLEFYSKNQTDDERAMQAEIEAVRSVVIEPMRVLMTALKEAQTGIEYATALFEFMETLNVYDKLDSMKTLEIEKGRLLEASEHEQAWNGFVDVLDQFVAMFGNQEMTIREVMKILDEGFDTLEFSRIPPSVDQVTVATADLARLSNMKAVFVIGVNDGAFPTRIEFEGMIADSEREWFSKMGHEIAPTSKERLLEEDLIIYSAFTAASDKLCVSYALSDEEGKSLLPSLFIKKLQDLTGVEEQIIYMTPDEALTSVDDWSYISHPRTAIAYLMNQIRQSEHDQQPLSAEWQQLQKYYENDLTWRTTFKRLMKSVTNHNKTEDLEQNITDALYGKTITSSVSRVEKYFKCPFAHFATYGLKLNEREEYRLDPPTIGDLFHAALKWISDKTTEEDLKWGQLSIEECKKLANDAVQVVVPLLYHQILLSSARYQYILRKLTMIVERTMISMRHHARNSGFTPLAIEAAFGPNEAIPPLTIDLPNKKKMQIRGRIDRIDSTKFDDQAYLRIVDYKSSAQKLDMNDIYHGLSLQMLTYLDVAVENADHWMDVPTEAGGVLYVHMHNPMLKEEKILSDSESESEILKKFKMSGLVLDSPDVILEMDESLEDIGGRSEIVPVYVKKDGTVSKGMSSVINQEELGDLRTFVRKKHREAGEGIMDGKTTISPFKLKQKTACDYCPQKSVCQFDTTDLNQSYRNLSVNKSDEVIDKIKKEAAHNDSN